MRNEESIVCDVDSQSEPESKRVRLNSLQAVGLSNLCFNIAAACYIGCSVLLFSTAAETSEDYRWSKIGMTLALGIAFTVGGLVLVKEKEND